MDESELGDDGKAWICCDTCDKWVSIHFAKKHIINISNFSSLDSS